MVTVTGEPLSAGKLKRSIIKTDAGSFSIDYAESDKVQFSVLSAGKAAERGTWTVIGPSQQCMILGKNANKIKKALVETEKISLVKKRGVYWLPAKPCQSAGSPAKGAGRTAPLAAARSHGNQLPRGRARAIEIWTSHCPVLVTGLPDDPVRNDWDCGRNSAKPTALHQLRLKRLSRYLVIYPV